ncbi:pilus assembly FimT family protein [Pseudaestuariivita sp.]|uniref:pilus assembly FimT family protein n=1 Tax=Pseudaestuariivita sp. TaxID=2211669 RepID=UPI0040589DC7
MPTSRSPWRAPAVGDAQLSQRRADAGVTLIEVLVVLALIAVGAGVVGYALPGGPSTRDLEQEADLLAARINLAAEKSLVSGAAHRLAWTREAYRFEVWGPEGWRAAPEPPLSTPHALETGMQLTGAESARNGEMHILPSLIPRGGAIEAVTLRDGALAREVRFDGATARAGSDGT